MILNKEGKKKVAMTTKKQGTSYHANEDLGRFIRTLS